MYFAVYKGKKCVCGYGANFLAADKPDGTCEKKCYGDMSIKCGGYDAYDLYELSGYIHSGQA